MRDRTSIGLLIQRRRKELKLTQAELASQVSVSVSHISMIERGARPPTRDIAERIANCLFVDGADRLAFVTQLLSVRSEPAQYGSPLDAAAQPAISISLVSLLGREEAIREIFSRLKECRLLTLIGSGGIGKTRIAETIVAELNHHTPRRAHFIPLAALNDADRLPAAILFALGIPLHGSVDPLDQLLAYLSRCNLLVALDNFEHLRNATRLLVDILQQAPHVKLLVTSRVRLELSMEHTYEVRALAIPGPHQHEDLEQYSAARLFVQRARQVHPTFELTPQNAPDVSRICRLVGGLPLGIELAAGWMHFLSCATIASELASGIDILTTTFQDVPERHRSMRAVLDYSWRMLTPAEQRTLRHLSVFRGGFTLDVAAEVVGAERTTLRATLGRLSTKCLITLNEASTSPQYQSADRSDRTQLSVLGADEEIYTMHEITRQYGWEQLSIAEEEQTTRDSHLAAMIALAERWAPGFHAIEYTDTARSEAVRHLAPMIDDQRAALEWAIQAGRIADDGWRLGGALIWFWFFEGYWSEGRQWLHMLLERGPAEGRSSARASALYATAVLDWYQGDHGIAQQYIGEALRIWRDNGDARSLVHVLAMQGIIALFRGDVADAATSFDESVATGRRVGNRWSLALALALAGLVQQALGQPEAARACFTEALAHFRAMKDSWGEQMALSNLGDLALTTGATAEAARLYEQVLALSKTALGTSELDARALHGLGFVALAQKSCDLARERLLRGLAIGQELNFILVYAGTLCGLAGVALGKGMAERAVWLLGATDSVSHLFSRPLGVIDAWQYQNVLVQARAELGDAACQAALEAGRQVDFAHALDVAMLM